jgi:hypothetical protein
MTWSEFVFNDFFPLSGEPDGGPFYTASFDFDTQFFTWDSTGSPRGIYEWQVTATNQFGMDRGSIIVDVRRTADVPEPSIPLLIGIAIVGMSLPSVCGRFRR